YVTGRSGSHNPYKDYATVAYDADGNERWVARYNGPADNSDSATAIAVDGWRNVYVTGQSKGVGTETDYATVAYDFNGNERWIKRFDGPSSGSDLAYGLAVDSVGNVYVTGRSWNDSTSTDYATVAYDSDGNERWVRTYDGPGSGVDWASAVAVDHSGNVYVTGYSAANLTGDDYATVAYDCNGNERWVRRFDGPASRNDHATAIAVDGSGNVYVTGHVTVNTSDFKDYATVAYDSNGNERWVRTYDGPAGGGDGATAVDADNAGNVFVTGTVSGGAAYRDYATVAYDFNGDELWARLYDGPASINDDANAIAADGWGNVYVTGGSAGNIYDYATVAYDRNGDQQWVRRYDGPASREDHATAITVGGSGNVYVTGWCDVAGADLDYATIKYETSTGVTLMRDKSVQTLDPPPRKSDFLPMDPISDAYIDVSPGAKDPDIGILSNTSSPLVFYQLAPSGPVLTIIGTRAGDTVQFLF
ncbi:SBBP repeat-containing protein, partial [Acidobacteriota bacterium]